MTGSFAKNGTVRFPCFAASFMISAAEMKWNELSPVNSLEMKERKNVMNIPEAIPGLGFHRVAVREAAEAALGMMTSSLC